MISQRFRIKMPLVVLVEVNGFHVTRDAAVGDVVTVTSGPLDGTRMVEVQWNGQIGLMFTLELREHAELIAEAASGS